jgi:DNA-directed RNA polymerase specialized sigma24 family protein
MHLDDVLTELVEHCGDRLLRVAYQLTHDAAAAQDLVQEALLRDRRATGSANRGQKLSAIVCTVPAWLSHASPASSSTVPILAL